MDSKHLNTTYIYLRDQLVDNEYVRHTCVGVGPPQLAYHRHHSVGAVGKSLNTLDYVGGDKQTSGSTSIPISVYITRFYLDIQQQDFVAVALARTRVKFTWPFFGPSLASHLGYTYSLVGTQLVNMTATDENLYNKSVWWFYASCGWALRNSNIVSLTHEFL